MTDVPADPPCRFEGYRLQRRPNPLARRACWYVYHIATGVAVGWVGLTGPRDGGGWAALSYAHRAALRDAGTPHDPDWWTGCVVWGDEGRSPQEALDALVASTGDLWLVEAANRTPPPPVTAHAAKEAARRVHGDPWYAPYRDELDNMR